MNKKIIFTDLFPIPEEYNPIPASKMIPEWYKNIDAYYNKEKKPLLNNNTSATVKRCMPVFDSITNGYIIVTHSDIFISKYIDENGHKQVNYQWSNFDALSSHSSFQFNGYPRTENKNALFKFRNIWGIKTPKGYSCLFVPPMHRDNKLVILPAIVDTDTYHYPVEFTFELANDEVEGMIPAGTPIAQIMPFKRDGWKMEFGKDKDREEFRGIFNKLRCVWFDAYKRFYRQPKDYR